MPKKLAMQKEINSRLPSDSGAPFSAPALTGGNENTGLLKLIAIACMLTDHIGVAFFSGQMGLRMIGRIAFPLFAWCLCVGAEHTRNIWKYALRLLLVGLLSQPMYVLGMNHHWYELNVFATLLVSLLGIAAIRENRFGSRYWGPALCILLGCAVRMDYNWQGILLIFLLYACRKQRAAIAAILIAYCLYWGNGTALVTQVLGVPIPNSVAFLPKGDRLFADIRRLQFWAILALPLILWPMRGRLRVPKWLSYAAYPGHLLVIALIRNWPRIMALFGR